MGLPPLVVTPPGPNPSRNVRYALKESSTALAVPLWVTTTGPSSISLITRGRFWRNSMTPT